MTQKSKNRFFFILVFTFFRFSSAENAPSWDDLEYREFSTSQFYQKAKRDTAQKTTKFSRGRQISSDDGGLHLSKDFKSSESFILIRDPEVLELLEKKGFSLSSMIANEETVNLEILFKKNANYKKIADTIRTDLRELMNKEKSGVGMAFSKRVFDANWFSSAFAQFELVGVINRIDRAVFDPATCGETRLVYRLAYHSKTGNYSRLPVTFMVKFINPAAELSSSLRAANCAGIAAKWIYPAQLDNNIQLADWLVKQGPLSNYTAQNSSSIEFNLQAMRIPSKARPDLAGNATYLLRAFSWNSARELVPKFLENTIDIGKFQDSCRVCSTD